MKIQLALDFLETAEAMKVAEKAGRWVDILEAGTPLVKSAGMESVRKLRERFPDKEIMADTKTADVGFIEAGMVKKAGANFMTVLAASPDGCIKECVRGAEEKGIEVLADTIGVKNLKERIGELKSLGINHVILHRGIDERRDCGGLMESIPEIKESFGVKISVAGGINAETAKKAMEYGVDVVIVGRHITSSENPGKTAELLFRAVKG